jgi:hypothetical protein
MTFIVAVTQMPLLMIVLRFCHIYDFLFHWLIQATLDYPGTDSLVYKCPPPRLLTMSCKEFMHACELSLVWIYFITAAC